MNKRIQKIIIFWGIIFAFFICARSALALEITYPTINILGQSFSVNSTSGLPEYARYFFNLGIVLAISVAVLTIIFGGAYYLISFSTGKFTDEGKDWVKAGATGLLIIMCSYLIVYTINPSLVAFKLDALTQILSQVFPNNSTQSNATTTTYQEIPMGTLTENLLTKTMDCYGFDQNGDPIDGTEKTDDGSFAPTYLSHDRVDCITQLADAAQKKAAIIAAVADKINQLMQTCQCSKTKCRSENSSFCLDPSPSSKSDCYNGNNNGGQEDSCIQKNSDESCCDTNTKNQIEHGQIDISGLSQASCSTDATSSKQYNGLDEFRCDPNPIPGDFQSCDADQIKASIEVQTQLNGKNITIINQKNWKLLNLIQQLTYFKSKISEIQTAIKNDKTDLSSAKTTLGQCYLAMPYVDFFKTYQANDQTKNIILTTKFSGSQGQVDASKYCNGFNYGNSSCLEKCNNECPDTSKKVMDCYKGCKSCENNDPACWDDQETCIENCYNSRTCTNGPDTSQTFLTDTNGDTDSTSCISTCQSDCESNCTTKYSTCSVEYSTCQNLCKDNSQCVLNNAADCLFGAQGFIDCANNQGANDAGNITNCINDAYLCKNGSDENAGYPDCADTTAKCLAYGFSSSSLYLHPECQKCGTGLCPETAKCPASSDCANCPCGEIDTTKTPINFTIPNQNNGNNAGSEGSTQKSQTIKEKEITSPECNLYSYNDDPMTFYCKNNWINDPAREGTNPTPIGKERICQPDGEAPVGQTVDGALDWADSFSKSTDDFSSSLQNILDDANKINKKQKDEYCTCSSKYDSGDPICTSNCDFIPASTETTTDPDTGDTTRIDIAASCAVSPCSSNSCQQMIDYLVKIWNDSANLKSGYVTFYTSMLQEPRSDILKELTYSRKQINACSLTSAAYGTAVSTRMLDCTRVENEIISPINTQKITYDGIPAEGCYGSGLDIYSQTPLTDNWFCCQEYR